MIFSPWLLAWLLATWRVNTLAPPAPLLRSTLLLPRADQPRLLEIDFSLPRVSDSIDSAAAAAAAACVVRAEVGSELAPAPRLLAASGHWSLLRPGSGGSAPAPAHLHFHFYYSLLQRYLKKCLITSSPPPSLPAHPCHQTPPPPAVPPSEGGCRQWKLPCVPWPAPLPRPWRSHREEISTRALGLVPGGERSGNTGEGERRRKPLCSLFSVHLGRTAHVARGPAWATGGSKLNMMGHGE